MQYPIAIVVAFGAVGFHTNSMVIGTKIVINEIILKILLFMSYPFFYSTVKSTDPVKFSV